MLNILQFDGSPIDDAMLEIQVLVGDTHAAYVRVADILPVEDQVGFKLLWGAIHTWDPDRERCSQIHALSSMELEEERAPGTKENDFNKEETECSQKFLVH